MRRKPCGMRYLSLSSFIGFIWPVELDASESFCAEVTNETDGDDFHIDAKARPVFANNLLVDPESILSDQRTD